MIVEALCFISVLAAIFGVLMMKAKSTPSIPAPGPVQAKKKPKAKETKGKPKPAPVKSLPAQPAKKAKEPETKKEKKPKTKPVIPEKEPTIRQQLESLSIPQDNSDHSGSDEWQTVEKKPKTKSEKPTEQKSAQKDADKSKKNKNNEKIPVKSEIISMTSAPKQASNPTTSPKKQEDNMEVEVYQQELVKNMKELDLARKEAAQWEQKYNSLLSGSGKGASAADKNKDGEVKEKLKKLQTNNDVLQSKLMARESECSMLKEQLNEINKKLMDVQSSGKKPAQAAPTMDTTDPVLVDTLQSEIRRLAKELVIVNQRNELLESKLKASISQMSNRDMMGQPNSAKMANPAAKYTQNQMNDKQKELDTLKESFDKKDKEILSFKEKIEELVKKNVELTKSINVFNASKQSQEKNIDKKIKETQESIESQKQSNLMIQVLEKELSKLKEELKTKAEMLTQVEKKHEKELSTLKKEMTKNQATEKTNDTTKQTVQNGVDPKIQETHERQIREFVMRIKSLETEKKAKDATLQQMNEKLANVEKKLTTKEKPNNQNGIEAESKKLIERINFLEMELNKKMKSISSPNSNEEQLKNQLNEREKDNTILNNRIRELEEEMRNKFENCSINGDVMSVCSQALSEEDFASLQAQLVEERSSKKLLQKNLTKLRSLINIGQDALKEEQEKASKLREEIIQLKSQLA